MTTTKEVVLVPSGATEGPTRITMKRAAAEDTLGFAYGIRRIRVRALPLTRVVVERVDPSGIAFAAGVRVGMIVVEANGQAVTDNKEQLKVAMAGQKEITLDVRLEILEGEATEERPARTSRTTIDRFSETSTASTYCCCCVLLVGCCGAAMADDDD